MSSEPRSEVWRPPTADRRLFPAVFLDKDGTLIADVPYNADPALIRLLPGAAEGARLLHEAGYALVVVTNQSGVARGYFPASALAGVEARLRALLAAAGVPLAGFYACPHHPDGIVPKYARECDCRKPAPGMLLRAAAELGLDLARSWMVGDILNDVEAGHRAGCRAALVDNGGETEWLPGPHRIPDLTAPDLLTAARLILAETEIRQTNHQGTEDTKKEHQENTMRTKMVLSFLRLGVRSWCSCECPLGGIGGSFADSGGCSG